MIVDGESLAVCIKHCLAPFLTLTTRLSAVICCRCSPTQKAQITELIKKHTGRRVCCIGDGGNDVSMIQAAHVGVGIVGKEGKQASLAADFSITQFSHLTRLIRTNHFVDYLSIV
jgi:phospholipid-translocating ATPase